LIPKAQKFVLSRPLIIYTPHNVEGILNSKEGLWLSDSHLLKYQSLLLEGSEITFQASQNLKPASFLPDGERKPEHSCKEVLMEHYAARCVLTDHSLDNSDLVLYTDRNSFVRNRIRHAGFVEVSDFGTIQSGPLPPNTSTQLAELVALTKALELSIGKRVNIYTNSKYAFLILQAHVANWKEWGMLITTGCPVKYSQELLSFLDAVLLPKQVSVILCPGHQKRNDTIARGN
jgi:ribonuclease HI